MSSWIPSASSIGDFIYNRRRALKWTGYVMGGAYLGYRYVRKQMSSALTSGMRERVEHDDILQRFENNLQDSEFTTLALLPMLRKQLDPLSIEPLKDELARRKNEAKAAALAKEEADRQKEKEAGNDKKDSEEEFQNKNEESNLQNSRSEKELTDSTTNVSNTNEPESQKNELSSPEANTKTEISKEHEVDPNDITQLSRAEIWYQIKCKSIARAVSSIYMLVFVVFATHIQLSLLGRNNYVKSTLERVNQELSNKDNEGTEKKDLSTLNDDPDADANEDQMFLTLSWWLLHKGCNQITERVLTCVEDLIGDMSLKTTIVYEELPSLLNDICLRVEQSFDLPHLLFPMTEAETIESLVAGGISTIVGVPDHVQRMLNESIDFANSRDGRKVCASLTNKALAHLTAAVEPAFVPADHASSAGSSRFEDVTHNETILANLLPIMARQDESILGSNPNEYVDELSNLPELTQLCAIIFTGYGI